MYTCIATGSGVDIRYIKLWQTAEIDCLVPEKVHRFSYRWYRYDVSEADEPEPLPVCQSTCTTNRICSVKPISQHCYLLRFCNVSIRDHGTRYICRWWSSSYYVDISVYGETFKKVPVYRLMTSPSPGMWSPIVGSAHNDTYNSTYAVHHKELRQPVIRIKCHVWASIRPFRLVWLKKVGEGNVEPVARKCSILLSNVRKPFSTTPLVWRGHVLVQGEMWSDLIVPTSSLSQTLGKYVCRIKWTDLPSGPESDVREVEVSNS